MIVIEIGETLAFTLRLAIMAYILHVVIQGYTVIKTHEDPEPVDASEEVDVV